MIEEEWGQSASGATSSSVVLPGQNLLLLLLDAPRDASDAEIMTVTTAVIRLLDEGGFDVNEATEHGRTPLYCACYKSLERVALRLLTIGVDDVDVKCRRSHTTLSNLSEGSTAM